MIPDLIQDLIWRFWPPRSVKAVRQAIDHELVDEPAGLILRPYALRMTNANALHNHVTSPQFSAQRVALALIMSAAVTELLSGRHFVYRGMLSLTGNNIADCYYRCLGRMREKGWYTDTQVSKAIALLQDQLAVLG